MFTKKYIFETKNTRAKRMFVSLFILTSILFTSFILLCIYIPIYAQQQNELAEQYFFKRSPDVIAVFTGDMGRIDHTLKKAERHPSAKIFITGVYAKNSLATLLKKQGNNISLDSYLNQVGHHIELDYLARNTVENGLATLNYLSKLQKNESVLIISSDYHIFRISRIMNALMTKENRHEVYYESIPMKYDNIHNLQKLVKEVYKFFKVSTFLLFWDRDTNF